jgi:hypothetical protein
MFNFSRNSGKMGFFDITMQRIVKKSGGTELKEKNDLFSLTSVPLNLEKLDINVYLRTSRSSSII